MMLGVDTEAISQRSPQLIPDPACSDYVCTATSTMPRSGRRLISSHNMPATVELFGALWLPKKANVNIIPSPVTAGMNVFMLLPSPLMSAMPMAAGLR